MSSYLYIDKKKYVYKRIEVPLPPLDLISWLSHQNVYPKMYWKERDQEEERAALGQLLTLDKIPASLSSEEEIRLYGGQAFSVGSRQEGLWKDFPRSLFFLPRYEVVQKPHSTKLIAHFIDTHTDKLWEKELSFTFSSLNPLKTAIEIRQDSPSESLWIEKITQCLEKIAEKEMEKVVFARKTTLFFSQPFSFFSLLLKLKEKANRATYFAFQIDPSSLFLGATPEKLYSRLGTDIRTEALAGTCRRGSTKEEDEKLQSALLNNEKENREFSFVKDFLQMSLSPYCHSLNIEEKSRIFQTPTVQHLYKGCVGTLLPSTTDSMLLQILHPTPALGGTPTKQALHYLLNQETFDRGWYAGPIGWVSSKGASFAAGIRSALAETNKLHLFAGTGIVAGSDPEQEWKELEYKISQFLALL